MKKFVTTFVLCILMLMGGFFTLETEKSSPKTIQASKTIMLPTHTLKNQSFIYTQSFIGSVEAIQSVEIVPYLSGFLKEIRVRPGSEVKKGDILFLLDDRIPLADLDQAKEAATQANAARTNAENYYQRVKNTESKAISSTELEQAKTEFQEADAAYQKALAAQKQAQTLYDYTFIRAPIDGWVGNISATVGKYLSPKSNPLATIVGFSPIRLTFSVPMALYKNDFSAGKSTLQVVLSDGHVIEFNNFNIIRDNHAEKSTDSLTFFIDVPNKEKFLMPGAYTEIRFLHPETGILVDKNWITLTPDGAEATILNQGIVEKRYVQIAAPIGNQYWIKSGLNQEDLIITVPVPSHLIGQPAQGENQ